MSDGLPNNIPDNIKELIEEDIEISKPIENFSDVIKGVEVEFKKNNIAKFKFCYPTLCVVWDGEKIHFELSKGGEIDPQIDEYLLSVASSILIFILSHIDQFTRKEKSSWRKYV